MTAIGSGAWLSTDTAGTVYTVSGLTFEPKALMIWTMGLHSATNLLSQVDNHKLCLGFAASATDRRAIGVLAIDAAGSADTQEIYRADAVLCYPTAAAAVDGLLDLQSFTADGFTLIVDDQVSFSVTYFWMVWGGPGITTQAADGSCWRSHRLGTGYVNGSKAAMTPDSASVAGVPVLYGQDNESCPRVEPCSQAQHST